MKPIRLVLIPPNAEEDASYLLVSQAGVITERGVLTLGGRPAPLRTVAIVPGADVLVRWLDLPAGSPAQQRAAALWSLSEELAAPADRLVLALGVVERSSDQRLAAVANRAQIEAWNDYLSGLGVRADVFVPDCLAVMTPVDESVNAVAFGAAVALRGRTFAATIQEDLVELVADGRDVNPVEDPDLVQQGLVAVALNPPINLAMNDDREAGLKPWRRSVAMAAVAMASPLILAVATAGRDAQIAGLRNREALALVARADPTLAERPDGVQLFLDRAFSAPPPGGPVAATAALFTALEPIENAELDILVADPGQGLKATVSHSDYADMRKVDAALRGMGMTLEETSTIQDGDRIVSDITLKASR